MALTLETFLPYRLARLAEAVSAEIRPVYKNHSGLTRPEWRVLVALADIGPTTATATAAHSAQHKTKVSRAVFALEQRRWLTREPSAQDRRFERLALTAAGHRAYRDLSPLMRVAEGAILERLTTEERAALEIGLAGLERAFELGSRPDAAG